MVQEGLTTYVPKLLEDERRLQERQVVQEGEAIWRRRKEELQRQKHREQREIREMLARYSPWGKPGGGAPCAETLRKKNVPLESPMSLSSTNQGQGWTSKSTMERLHDRKINNFTILHCENAPGISASHSHLIATPSAAEERRVSGNAYNEEIQVYELTGGVELVPLLRSTKHYAPPHTTRYIATDATRPGYTIETLRALGVGNREYMSQLTEQIRRKRDKALEERRMEQESCRRHFDTWRRLWGRPGHGAPMDHPKRNNLYDILYRPAIY